MQPIRPSLCLLPLLPLLLACLPGQALVQDIRPGSGSSDPTNLVAMGGIVYFLADTPATGIELWRSDGSSAGTWMVKDINPTPGVSGFRPLGWPVAPQFVVLGNQLLFWANDGITGQELWSSDGTAAGTNLLADINPGPGDGVPGGLTVVGNRVFFSAMTPATSNELWVTDGTTAGTHMVVDFQTTPFNGGGVRQGAPMLAFGNGVFFTGSSNFAITDNLCYSDGTAAGTYVVNTAVTNVSAITRFGNRAVFYGSTPATGFELWISDGTSAGTQLIGDLEPGTASLNPASFGLQLTEFNGRLYFGARNTPEGRALWSSDGTPAGTYPLFAPSLANPLDVYWGFFVAGDRIYVSAYGATTGTELWITDGVAMPTLITDFNPGTAAGFDGGSWLPIGNGRMALTTLRRTNNGGFEPGVVDGTAAGSRVLTDLAPGSGNSSWPRDYTRIGDRVLFSAEDDGFTGRELYALTVSTLGAAENSPYGTGCPGANSVVPSLAGIGAPTMGNSQYAMRMTGGLPATLAAIFVGFTQPSIPAGTCAILVPFGASTFAGLTDAQGRFTLPLAIPSGTGFVGFQLFAQGMVLDPAGGMFGGVSATQGLRVRLGN